MNQRLEADTLTLVADEFGYKIEFADADFRKELKRKVQILKKFITKSSDCYGNGTCRPR